MGGEFLSLLKVLRTTEHSEKSGGKRDTPADISVRDIFVPVCCNIDRDNEMWLPNKDGFRREEGVGEKRAKQEVKFIPNLQISKNYFQSLIPPRWILQLGNRKKL